MVSTVGSCACFTLSRLIGRSLARAIWPEQLAKYALEVRPSDNSAASLEFCITIFVTIFVMYKGDRFIRLGAVDPQRKGVKHVSGNRRQI